MLYDYRSYLQIAFCPIAMLIILYTNSKHTMSHGFANRPFCRFMLLTIVAVLFDTVGWLLIGQTFRYANFLLWAVNILSSSLIVLVPYAWLCYTTLQLNGRSYLTAKRLVLAALPMLLVILMALSSPWTHSLFYIDTAQSYHRGAYSLLQTFVAFFYLFWASARALLQRRKEKSRDSRRECLYLASFILLPLVGASIQSAAFGVSLIWPSTALSLLLIYINLRNQQISLDALTGLNNRGQFDRYLYGKCRNHDSDKSFFLLMMDLDHFKQINDLYGHPVGDEALCTVADILKKVFAKEDAFLSRYGGDEFAIVLHCPDEAYVKQTLGRVTDALQTENAHTAQPYTLSLSIGIARFGADGIHDDRTLINAADTSMYHQKRQKL